MKMCSVTYGGRIYTIPQKYIKETKNVKLAILKYLLENKKKMLDK